MSDLLGEFWTSQIQVFHMSRSFRSRFEIGYTTYFLKRWCTKLAMSNQWKCSLQSKVSVRSAHDMFDSRSQNQPCCGLHSTRPKLELSLAESVFWVHYRHGKTMLKNTTNMRWSQLLLPWSWREHLHFTLLPHCWQEADQRSFKTANHI